jgi:SAM-dependent MidA family methyltransferase
VPSASLPQPDPGPGASGELARRIARSVNEAGGWLPFDRYMQQALYAPGLGYYARPSAKFGWFAGDGSDFVTAPELSPLFGRALARQLAEALRATGTDEIWEFGAGSGALAEQIVRAIDAAGTPLKRYTIVDVSGALRAQQQRRLAPLGDRVRWADALPEAFEGVLVGNEVLDAMPVKLLARQGGAWYERGVALDGQQPGFCWADRPTTLRPPVEIEGGGDYVTETHPQAEAFMRTIAERLRRGAAFWIDYGFPEREYYHPQRSAGTLVCHQAHRMNEEPLVDAGQKDITAHVNFTGVALAAQDAGLAVLGYTSQGRFLLNCGLSELMQDASVPERTRALKLVNEHEMGELFKVIAMTAGEDWAACGFAVGDRTHRL